LGSIGHGGNVIVKVIHDLIAFLDDLADGSEKNEVQKKEKDQKIDHLDKEGVIWEAHFSISEGLRASTFSANSSLLIL